MIIELIPVIEIGYFNQGVTTPANLNSSIIWNSYREECFQKAGLKDKLEEYKPGSSLYQLSTITFSNLTKLTIDNTKELREGKYGRAQSSPFFGGYVLRVEGQDKYFPQCCGKLSDINYWDRVSKGQNSNHDGHPAPLIKFENENIIFDFSVNEFEEQFQPTPLEIILSISSLELKKAVEKVMLELHSFESILRKINEHENLNIDNIGMLLIWGDTYQA